MSGIISYAQNFEDVMLWRALGHTKNGFYIDIGAQDPLVDSVSLAFHEHGWHGIHVEPTPHYAEMLRQQRPGDKIIQAAISTDEGVINFFEIPETGISTADAIIAQQHRERGFEVKEIAVVSITLAAVFAACAEPEIHWLKIDVEGFEQQVLNSWSPSPARPWIVVVESTLPSTQIETHEAWESILLSYGYTPVYFDGLNRYYISTAHPELQQAFRAPPNIFDGFWLNGTASFPIYHLIADRHKQQISEIVAQNEKQGFFVKKEMERLNQSLVELSQTYTEQRQASDLHEAEITAQLQTIQQQAEAERNELRKQHHTQLQEIQRQHAEHEWLTAERIHQLNHSLQQSQAGFIAREQYHAENVSILQTELSNLLRAQVQREQDFNAQLQNIQQQAAQEKVELTHHHDEQIHTLRHEYAEREQALNQQLRAGQQQLHDLEQVRADMQHQLNAQLQAERVASQRLNQALTEVRQILATTHSALTWRITAPLRAFGAFIAYRPNSNATSNVVSQNEVMLPVIESSAINVPQIYNETAMFPSSPATNLSLPPNASTLKELLAYHDQLFVRAAYHSLLGREPDLEGEAFYLEKLRSGNSKIHILTDIHSSAEGRAYGTSLPGLKEALLRRRLRTIPLIGWLIHVLSGEHHNSVVERTLQRIENQLFVMNEQYHNRFNQVEITLARLSTVTQKMAAQTELAYREDQVDMASQEITGQQVSKIRDTPMGTDPHVLEVLSELQATLNFSKESRL